MVKVSVVTTDVLRSDDVLSNHCAHCSTLPISSRPSALTNPRPSFDVPINNSRCLIIASMNYVSLQEHLALEE